MGLPGPTVKWSVCREAPFFGFSLIPTDFLIVQSTFFQRIICVFLVLDGLGQVTYLVPPFATSIYPVIVTVSALGEIPLYLAVAPRGGRERATLEGAGGQSGGTA